MMRDSVDRQGTSRPAPPAVGVHMQTWHGGEKMTERTSELPPDEPDEAPEGFREQPRYAPTVQRAYANGARPLHPSSKTCMNGGFEHTELVNMRFSSNARA